MRVQFIGSGDAFGSGGRRNTCFHVTGAQANFLIDCGASSLIGMNAIGIDRNAIDLILITHFHADHFGGLPFFVLDAQFVARRTRPLVVAGPPGLRDWYTRLFNATFPGERKLPFELELREFEIAKRHEINGMIVTPYHVRHDDKAGPCLAYRIEIESKILCYSGDTEWTDALIEAARSADLFVCECYTFERPAPAHLSYSVLRSQLDAIGARRVVLTHMSEDMLQRLDKVDCETAEDGMVVEF